MKKDKANNLLLYKSEPILCGFPKDEKSIFENILGWKISDETRSTDKIERDCKLYEYQIVLEKPVKRMVNREKQMRYLYDLQDDAFSIINDLKLVWPFAFAGIEFSHKTYKGKNAPKHWTSNSREILEKLHPQKYNIELSVKTEKWLIAPERPIKRLLNAYYEYKKCDDHVSYLIHFYNNARNSNGDASLFIYAKALEILRKVLDGKNDTQKTKNLPPEVKEELSKDLYWLFKIANNRIEIRHAVDKKGKSLLLPELNDKERAMFISNSSILIRSYITKSFGLEFDKIESNKFTVRNGGRTL